jgi:hypothetical protein
MRISRRGAENAEKRGRIETGFQDFQDEQALRGSRWASSPVNPANPVIRSDSSIPVDPRLRVTPASSPSSAALRALREIFLFGFLCEVHVSV